jgi:hypothetical protein
LKTVNTESFEVLVDNNDTDILGLQVNPANGEPPFVIPMARSTATDVGMLLILVK